MNVEDLQSTIVFFKRRALQFKKEGNLEEAKRELAAAKALEDQLEMSINADKQELLGGSVAETSSSFESGSPESRGIVQNQ